MCAPVWPVSPIIRITSYNVCYTKLLRGELYLSCAFAGAGAALLLTAAGAPGLPAAIGCGLVTFALRAGSLRWGWKLPVYKPRPPRTRG